MNAAPADPDQAAEYRRRAGDCLEYAQRMSSREDRARLTEMARQWLELAYQAERKKR
jgi:hypothetical protein